MFVIARLELFLFVMGSVRLINIVIIIIIIIIVVVIIINIIIIIITITIIIMSFPPSRFVQLHFPPKL